MRERPPSRDGGLPQKSSPAAVVPVAAVMVMARAAEAVVPVPVAAMTEVPAVVAVMRPVLGLLDRIAGGRGRLGRDRERSGLRGVGRGGEAQAGDRDRQGGGFEHGLSGACQHDRMLRVRSVA